ncbi:MAG: hypothetical protein LBK68_00635 [Candidatus Margulisbacteria bacterium]|jgi:hypothetical protein|nr:hypothetical protein [Candidatus Margulisiibacteriota bacterium]
MRELQRLAANVIRAVVEFPTTLVSVLLFVIAKPETLVNVMIIAAIGQEHIVLMVNAVVNHALDLDGVLRVQPDVLVIPIMLLSVNQDATVIPGPL